MGQTKGCRQLTDTSAADTFFSGGNNEFSGQLLTGTTEVDFYTSDRMGNQLIWFNGFNGHSATATLTISIYQAAANAGAGDTYPVSFSSIPGGDNQSVNLPGIPLREGDIIKAQASVANVITLTATIADSQTGETS